MPESRDRLIRREPETPLIFNRRSVGGVLIDTDQERRSLGVVSPVQFGATTTTTTTTRGRGGRIVGSPWSGRRARARNNRLLPSWYPRRPLQDITAVVDAIERRRARLREAESHRLASPPQQDFNTPGVQQESNTPISGAPLEHRIPLELSTSLTTPKPKDAAVKSSGFPVHIFQKALLNSNVQGESEFITPQKKLLNSIDQVDKVMKEEFKRLKSTPAAKRAERDNKVRTLMTMR